MIYFGIDPGTEESGWAKWDGEQLLDCGVDTNDELLAGISWRTHGCVVGIEMIGHYGTGMAVGKEVFHTCVFIGRLLERLKERQVRLILRPSVKAAICGSARAKDPNVVQALKDQIGAKGTKANPGPLYGIKSHAWQALALAVAMQRGAVETVQL